MYTGSMSDCVSMIVLWNPVGGVYTNVRGYHGGGGLPNVNWGSLFAGVANHATTQVYMISGFLQGSDYAQSQNVAAVNSEIVNAGLANVTVTFIHGVSGRSIDRNNVVHPAAEPPVAVPAQQGCCIVQ